MQATWRHCGVRKGRSRQAGRQAALTRRMTSRLILPSQSASRTFTMRFIRSGEGGRRIRFIADMSSYSEMMPSSS